MYRTLLHAALLTSMLAPAALSDSPTTRAEPNEPEAMSADTFSGLAFRSIGPAFMSGRIGDIAVNPNDHAHWVVAVASGNVWVTRNAGTTWTPVFDDQGSYSIGCVTLDPHNPHVIWVGTGENNSQRSVSFGDGVYRSRDGGKSWENVGLEESEHIGMIAIDPRDSDVVYVAAQGPLWRSGGDRGLYKTTDGGATWERILHISDDTGVNEVHLDPRDPDTLYASTWQRRRHVWTLINGGPESALYKSTDSGKTWRKLTSGLPEVNLGRIGLDIAPANPDIVYAIIEAAQGKSGVFRSTDRGETWEKRSDYVAGSPQYYNELVCDPLDPDHVYSLDTFLHETRDGGKTFEIVPRENRHVDDHALWIDPTNTDHLIVGSDGGVYETFDHGDAWRFISNLPITQFYRVTADNAKPFYNVYGGTQDNSTIGTPSRTTDRIGIANWHSFITVGGDGFKSQIDPEDPMIVYSQWQYGGLIRHDRRSGQILDIKPREEPGDAPYRWNWDSPLIISPHDSQRLYFAAQRVFRSDDGGLSWTTISADLTRKIDRNTLEVFGRIQWPDAVAKHHATSFYGSIVALDESPLVEGLVYAGTDDGLIQTTEDGGATWRKAESFPDLPKLVYVSDIVASQHDADTVYACFDNHKNGDFAPYVLRSTDRGRTWHSIVGNLPKRHVALVIQEDHVQPQLLFVGTEFGVFFTVDGGGEWIQLKGGVPTIAVRDMDIQKRENDLVLGTFGRSFYILDDYTPLRHVSRDKLEQPALLFPIKTALRYIERSRLGGGNGKGWQGAAHYAAPNPPFGAVFTYYLKEKLQTPQEARHEAEKEADEEGTTLDYPTLEDLRAEVRARAPRIILTVCAASGEVIRRIEGSRERGIHRVAWNLRYPAATPIDLSSHADRPPWWSAPSGPLALPGHYSVTLAVEENGTMRQLAGPVEFEVKPLDVATFEADDRGATLAFRKKVARLRRAVEGAQRVADDAQSRLDHVRAVILATPAADAALLAEAEQLQHRLRDLLIELRGDPVARERDVPSSPSIASRVGQIVGGQWDVTSPPTDTQKKVYVYTAQAFDVALDELRVLVEEDLGDLEARLEQLGAPWTPGRFPEWEPELD